jgi:hypothetical protein
MIMRIAILVLGAALWSCTMAFAQPPERRWELEVHVGGPVATSSETGTAIGEFPRGTTIPGGGIFDSRAVSSWYFGDGSLLFNQVSAAQNWLRITPLDPALRQPIARRRNGVVAGMRVTRHVSSRFALEFNIDYADTQLRLTEDAEAAIETTRASFASAWRSFVAGTVPTVTSVAHVTQGAGHQLITSGALRIGLGGTSRFRPYLTAGGGGMFVSGDSPSATLIGNYRISLGSTVNFDETDTVTIRTVTRDRAAIGVVGGGFTYEVTPRHGLRADARLHVGGPTVNTVIDATPASATSSTASVLFIVGSNPTIRFSTGGPLTSPSSLSGPRIEGLETFTGSGTSRQVTVTIGYFVRF